MQPMAETVLQPEQWLPEPPDVAVFVGVCVEVVVDGACVVVVVDGACVVVVVVGKTSVHMLPFFSPAASFVPSAEEVIPFQIFVAPVEVTSVQLAAADPWSALSSTIKQTDKRVFMACMVRR
jgi:hypothetical protein